MKWQDNPIETGGIPIYSCAQYMTPDETVCVHRHTKYPQFFHRCVHIHDFYEIAYFIQGDGENEIDGVLYPIKPGAFSVIRPGQTHDIIYSKQLLQVDILLRDVDFELPTDGHICFDGSDLLFAGVLINRICDEYRERHDGWQEMIIGSLRLLCTLAARRHGGSQLTRQRLPDGIRDYIDNHIHEQLSAERMADLCFFSTAHFLRIFRREFGMNFRDYVRMRRMNEAMRLLRETELSVDEIMERSGFGSRTKFFNAFKEKNGCTPGEYRKR